MNPLPPSTPAVAGPRQRLSDFVAANAGALSREAARMLAAEGFHDEPVAEDGPAWLHAVARDMESADLLACAAPDVRSWAPPRPERPAPADPPRPWRGLAPDLLLRRAGALRRAVLRAWVDQGWGPEGDALEEFFCFDAAADRLMEAAAASDGSPAPATVAVAGVQRLLGHALRAPLNVMTLGAEYLLSRRGMDESSLAAARRIMSGASRMSALIGDVLDGMSLVAVDEPPAVDPVDMAFDAACREAIAAMNVPPGHGPVEFQGQGGLRGRWDEDRLRQLLANLLAAALEMPAPFGPLVLSASGSEDSVQLLVPLSDAAAAAGCAGTTLAGLHLHVARIIAKAHGGRLDLHAVTGRGAVAILWLPRHG